MSLVLSGVFCACVCVYVGCCSYVCLLLYCFGVCWLLVEVALQTLGTPDLGGGFPDFSVPYVVFTVFTLDGLWHLAAFTVTVVCIGLMFGDVILASLGVSRLCLLMCLYSLCVVLLFGWWCLVTFVMLSCWWCESYQWAYRDSDSATLTEMSSKQMV